MSFETAEEAFSTANSYFVDEKYEAALAKYTDAIELDDKNASFYVARAAVHLQLKNEMEALDDSTKAIELAPKNEKAYLRKGMALFALGEYEMAKTLFLKGQNLNKSSTIFTNWLNKCDSELRAEMEREGGTQEMGNTDEPVAPTLVQPGPPVQEPEKPAPVQQSVPSTVGEEQKKQAEEAKTLGNQAFGKRKFKEAVQHYSKAIELDAQNHIYFSNRSMAYLRLGECAKALEDAEQVIGINHSWAKGYFRKGSALLGLKRYKEAEEAFAQGLKVSDEDKADLESALHTAQELVRFQDYESFQKLQVKKGGLSDKEVVEIVHHNLQRLQSEEFAKTVTTVTVTVGDFWRCMRLIVIDEDGKIVRLSPPSALVPADKSVFAQLREGDLALANAFVHVGKADTPKAKEQDYAFQEWVPRPDKLSSLTGGAPDTTLTSPQWNDVQRAILDITTKEANKCSSKQLNTGITAKLF